MLGSTVFSTLIMINIHAAATSPLWFRGRYPPPPAAHHETVGHVAQVRIPAKSNSIPEGSRTPFRREAEQHSGMIPNTIRSVATLAF
jgi:hypothetical protein